MMNTYFQICVTICLFMLGFVLVGNLIITVAPDVFPNPDISMKTGNIVESDLGFVIPLTGNTNMNLNAIWLAVASLALLGALTVAVFLQSIVPIGLYLYGVVFWTAYWRLLNMIGAFKWLDGTGLVVIFTVGLVFVFIASVIGMMTGSG